MKILAQVPPITNPALPIVGHGEGIDIVQLFLTNFINIILGVAGILAFFMLLWGSLEYIMAGGDKERTQNATKRITAAIVGLVLVFSVFAIIYVVETVFGINLRQFTFPTIQ